MSAHFTFGSVTRRNICQPLAPSSPAASSSSRPDASITAISSRATNGNDTKMVASTMPGSAKMILMSRSNSHGPNQPCRPKSCTKIKPATTGDTANGKSMSAVSRRLPRKSNLVIAQAAAMPKTAFAGTVKAATMSVSQIAERASGASMASTYACHPFRSASTKMKANGTKRKIKRNASATVVSATRTSTGSVSARRAGRAIWPNAT